MRPGSFERAVTVARMRGQGATIAQIAAALGVTERTVSRYVTDLGLAHEAPEHGSSQRYQRDGCRCVACTEAQRVREAQRRERRRAEGVRKVAREGVDLAGLDEVAAAHQARTLAAATRGGKTWTDTELAVALDPRRSTVQAAEVLGRSYAAVAHVRARNPGWRTRPRGGPAR